MFPAWEDCPEYTNFIRLELWRLTISGLVGQNAHTLMEAIQSLRYSNVRMITEHSNVLHLKTVHVSMYTAADQVLQLKTKYTIVAAGYQEYRGDHRWHFITEMWSENTCWKIS